MYFKTSSKKLDNKITEVLNKLLQEIIFNTRFENCNFFACYESMYNNNLRGDELNARLIKSKIDFNTPSLVQFCTWGVIRDAITDCFYSCLRSFLSKS